MYWCDVSVGARTQVMKNKNSIICANTSCSVYLQIMSILAKCGLGCMDCMQRRSKYSSMGLKKRVIIYVKTSYGIFYRRRALEICMAKRSKKQMRRGRSVVIFL